MSDSSKAAFQPQKLPDPPKPEKGGFNRMLLLIPVAAIVAVIAIFLYFPGMSSPGGGISNPGSLLISTQQKALDAVRANFTYFPAVVAKMNATELEEYWKVLLLIPGQQMMMYTINKSDGSLTVEKSINLYKMQIIAPGNAKDIARFMIGSGSKEMSAVLSGDYWFVQPSGEGFHYRIEKSTGKTWKGYGAYNATA
jgi:hypothetical protein